MKKKFESIIWIPLIFSACICFIALGTVMVGCHPIAFYCFLPMCFYFVAVAMGEMKKKINNLESAVNDLKNKE